VGGSVADAIEASARKTTKARSMKHCGPSRAPSEVMVQ
jgi:hypothetical protein